MYRLPYHRRRQCAEARRQGGLGAAHQARHGCARAIGGERQGRDAAERRQRLARRRRSARRHRVHGVASKVRLTAALLFIVDPLESLKAYKDSSVAMMRAAQARGHAIWAAEQTSLHWVKSSVAASATRLSLTDNDEDWYRAHDTEVRPLKGFGAVLMRKDPPFDLEYVASTWLLSAAVRDGA